VVFELASLKSEFSDWYVFLLLYSNGGHATISYLEEISQHRHGQSGLIQHHAHKTLQLSFKITFELAMHFKYYVSRL